MGGYERDPAPWSLDGIPADFNGKLLAEDWPRFEELLANAIVRVPALADLEVIRLINGPEAFTPGRRVHPRADRGARALDGGRLLRARAGRRRRDGAPRRGVDRRGNAVARHLGDGLAPLRRRLPRRPYTLARTREVYATYYDVKYPGHERRAGRPLRLSPTYGRLAELGAVFGEKSGWERANWFEPNAAHGDESLRPRGWAGRLWSPAIGAEHRRLPRRRGALRRDVVRQARGLRRGVGRVPRAPVREPVARDLWARHLHVAAEPPRRNRVRLHRHAARRRSGSGSSPARPSAGTTSRGSASTPRRASRSRTSPRATPASASGGREAREILQPLTPTPLDFPLPAGARARGRERPLPGAARHLRRRARLGALLSDRVRPRALGRDLGRRPRARARRRRLPRDRLVAPREGLPRLGRRHHARRHAVRGRPRLRREARQGRVHRPRSAARGDASRNVASAASCSTTRARSPSARSRCGSTAPTSAA